jgi:hypothetical protein
MCVYRVLALFTTDKTITRHGIYLLRGPDQEYGLLFAPRDILATENGMRICPLAHPYSKFCHPVSQPAAEPHVLNGIRNFVL